MGHCNRKYIGIIGESILVSGDAGSFDPNECPRNGSCGARMFFASCLFLSQVSLVNPFLLHLSFSRFDFCHAGLNPGLTEHYHDKARHQPSGLPALDQGCIDGRVGMEFNSWYRAHHRQDAPGQISPGPLITTSKTDDCTHFPEE